MPQKATYLLLELVYLAHRVALIATETLRIDNLLDYSSVLILLTVDSW